MVPRKAAQLVRQRLRQYPAVALVGPRQAGKTTLARALGGAYYDLEQEADRVRLDVQWNALVRGRRLVVLDEAQACPEVFPRLRGAIDQRPHRRGRFLLLGSVSPGLMVRVSESLAGRLSVVELTPLLAAELPKVPLATLWRVGGYPSGGILEGGRFPRWQRDYLALLAQRDLPNWGLPAAPQVTQHLLRMLAAVHAQLWNASQIGQSLGLSYHTVNTYVDYLVGAFLIRRLLPYQASMRKRLTKSPKVYWRDTGLLHALLGAAEDDDLLGHPWVGASWEGFVIEQVVGALGQADVPVEPFFLRTADGTEVDLVLDFGRCRWAFEIKLTSSPSTENLSRLNRAADLVKAERRILVSQVADSVAADGQVSCNLPWLLGHLGELR